MPEETRSGDLARHHRAGRKRRQVVARRPILKKACPRPLGDLLNQTGRRGKLEEISGDE
jgi:hypothetical protein